MLKKSAFVKKEAPLYQRVCAESHYTKREKRLSAVSQLPIIRASQFPPLQNLVRKVIWISCVVPLHCRRFVSKDCCSDLRIKRFWGSRKTQMIERPIDISIDLGLKEIN